MATLQERLSSPRESFHGAHNRRGSGICVDRQCTCSVGMVVPQVLIQPLGPFESPIRTQMTPEAT